MKKKLQKIRLRLIIFPVKANKFIKTPANAQNLKDLNLIIIRGKT